MNTEVHFPVANNDLLIACHSVYAFLAFSVAYLGASSKLSTPGSFTPAISSNDAPPPVET